jgi:hypothetical protein
MGQLIAGAKAFISANKIAFYLGLALLVVAILTLAYCTGRQDGKTGEVVKQQEREIEVQKDVGDANTKAADRRVEDAVKAEREQKELTDALKATTDPDRQRALRGCVILRQQGRDTSRIPACSGSGGRP